MVLVQLTVVSNVFPQQLVDSTLETNRLDQQIVRSEVAIILDDLLNSP